jgi:hypothetical protein
VEKNIMTQIAQNDRSPPFKNAFIKVTNFETVKAIWREPVLKLWRQRRQLH